MSTKPNTKGAQSPSFDLPNLPDLPELPELPDMVDMDDLPDVDDMLAGIGEEPPVDPLDVTELDDETSIEDAAAADDQVIDDQFAAIRAGRKQQQEAIRIANDSEYWCAVYFQTREQKEHFLREMKWIQHGDKYLDGQWIAKRHGIELPKRETKFKVGRLDAKLTDLT